MRRDIGNLDINEDVDMPQIYSVWATLNGWHTECGQFNYTFDSDTLSIEATLDIIANAAFCKAYRQSGKIRIAADMPQTESTMLFTHRNKKPKSETINRNYYVDSDFDGVEMRYVDPETNTTESFQIPIDGSAKKLKPIEIAGIRSFTQAWYRGNREYYKLKGKREFLQITTTADARALIPYARITNVDNTRYKNYDGEVIDQTGLVLTLSDDVQFRDGYTHSLVVSHRNGSIEGIVCTPGALPNQIVLAELPSEPLVVQAGVDGLRTQYSFAADADRGGMYYTVDNIDLSDSQYPKVTASIYSDAFYQADSLPVPDKSTIINY
jgi:hypothetical protein